MKVTIYTISDCQFSKQEKEFLTKNNIQFEEKNLETNKDFPVEMLQISNNFAGTPVTKIENDDGTSVVLKGFTAEELAKELGIQIPTETPAPQVQESAPAPAVGAVAAVAAIPPSEPVMPEAPAVPAEPAPEMPVMPQVPPTPAMPEPIAPESATPATEPMMPAMEPSAPVMPQAPAAPAQPAIHAMPPAEQFAPPVTPQTPTIDMAPPAPPAVAPAMSNVPEVAPAAPAAPAAAPQNDAALNDILNNLQQKVGDQNS